MLIPIGIEDGKVRRFPFVTATIIALCIIIHIVISIFTGAIEKKLETNIKEYSQYLDVHPYLQADLKILKSRFIEKSEVEIDIELKEKADRYSQETGFPGDEEIAEQQKTLDQLALQVIDAQNNNPQTKWGFSPAKKKMVTLVTYMFIHWGWLDLVLSLIFLYLAGFYVENAWGKTIFVIFYLLGGVVAAQAQTFIYPTHLGPLIGASGAVFAVFGAFSIRYWNVKFRILFFRLPAWAMIPIWILNSILITSAMNTIDAKISGSGVAHWIHILGFVFGAAIAILIKFLQIEEKIIKPKLIAQTPYINKSYKAFEDAKAVLDSGNKESAFDMFLEAAKKDSSYQDTIDTLWDLGVELGREREVAPFLIRYVEREVRSNRSDTVISHYDRLKDKIPDVSFSIQTKVKIAEILLAREETKEAANIINEVVKEISLNSPPGILLEACMTAHEIDTRTGGSSARKIIELSLQHIDIPQTKKNELKALLDMKPGPKIEEKSVVSDNVENVEYTITTSNYEQSQNEPVTEVIPTPIPIRPDIPRIQEPPPPPPIPTPVVPPPSIHKNLNVTNAVPVEIKEGKMTLNADGAGQRVLSLDRIKAISVVKITPPSERPYLLIDLFLNDPQDTIPEIRIIRVFSTIFNPKKFVPNAPNAIEAFRVFIATLLKMAGAKPYPDLESVQLKKINTFPSLEHYEDSLIY